MKTEDLDKIKKTKQFMLLPTSLSKDVEWINWMKALDKDYDRSTSVSMFSSLWSKRGSKIANTLELRQFMKKKYNLDLAEGVSDKVVDLGGSAIDTVSGIAKVGKISFFVVGGVVLLGAIGLIISIIKKPSNLAYATPQGRALKLMGGK